MSLLRRISTWLGRGVERKVERRAVVEEVEPRILYSADLNPALWAADASAQPVAIVAAVNPDEQFAAPAAQLQTVRHEIVFVDAAVPDAQTLIDAVLASRPEGTQIEVVQLGAGSDGVQQISDVLASETDLDAIHIISHGGPGLLQLGNLTLDAAALQARAAELQAWSSGLTAQADLMLYGCDVAQGETGQAFVEQLASLTGADVAASSDATGHESLGGDWSLEVQSGSIDTGIVFSEAFRAQWVELLPTYQQFTNYTSESEVKSDTNWGQTFVHTSGSGTYTVNEISLALRRDSGASAQTITVTLRSGGWNGTILGTASVASASLGTDLAFVDLSIADVTLTDGVTYTLRVTTNTTSGKVYAGFNSSGGYSGGHRIDSGGGNLTSEDTAFKVGYTAPPNTSPTIANLAGDGLAYAEGAGAVVIEQGDNATVTDAESANFDTGTLTVSFTAGSDSAEDVLAIRNEGSGAGQIGVSGANVTYGGTPIGTYAGGSSGSNLVITFNASSSPTAAQALIRNITYQNTDTGAPTTGARTVRFALTDGDGGTSANHDTTVTVSGVNDSPTGSVTINDTTPTQGQTLTASNSLADADGLGAITYTWKADGTTVGTGSAYAVTEAEVGKVITVVASYTDGGGTAESVTSAATAAVANVNDAPTGSVTIDDTTPTQGQTLTASNTLADADGLGAITYTWKADGSTVGTGSTYVVTEAAVGKVITVVASYTDGHGTAESVTSAATSAVANVNDAPSGSVTINDTTPTQSQTLTASSTLADADGLGTITYTWQADGSTVGTGTTYVVTEAAVGKVIAVVASYTDGHGTAESVTSAATSAVANVNDAPTGAPLISGSAAEGQTLSVDTSAIADADGLGPFSYQWQRDGVDIAGATASIYLLAPADVGANIRIVVSYVDGQGSAESLTSTPLGPVSNTNNSPSGAPAISGTFTENQVLTADTSSIADVDGLGAFSYQWLRNGVTIGGATSSTYALGDADVGTNIRVVVSYVDLMGTAESLTSSAAGPIANVNDAPTGSVTIDDTTPTQGQTLTASNTLADADGLGAITYAWQADGSTVGSGSTYVVTNAEVGKVMTVTASYIDGHGTAESVASAATSAIANVNDAPTGSVTIDDITPTQGQTLTASNSLADADGLGAITYTWQADGTTVGTGLIYVVTEAEVGKVITVIASYTDGHGTSESVSSGATAAVANVNDTSTGAVTIDDTTPTQGQTLTASNTLADADGLGAITYTWQADGSTVGTGSTYVVTEAEVGKVITVIASYTDGHGTPESVSSTSTAAVANVDDAPTGSVTIDDTTPTQGQTLTASNTLADADGLGAITYTWQADGSTVGTGTTYVVTEAQVGKVITVIAGYTDGHGTSESVSSGATAVVANVNDAPTGSVTIDDTTPTQGQTLTASNALADADGLGAITYTWQADGSTVGTGSTYVVTEAEVGKVITVIASYTDGHGTAEAVSSATTAAVANVNDNPAITSNGGGVAASISVAENQTAVAIVTSSDVDGGTPVYNVVPVASGGAADAALFNIDGNTGVLTFNIAPNFEAPADAGADNVYQVTVQVSDGNGGFDTQLISVSVSNVDEAPAITSDGAGATAAVSVAENTTTVTNVTATDADAGSTLTYSIVGGADAARFTIDSATGALRFVTAPDHEAPADSGANNVYDVTVQVSDGNNIDTQAIAVTVTPLNEAPSTTAVVLVPMLEDSGARLITQAELLANAGDVDGPSLAATGLTITGGNGSLVDNGNGTWSYTPALNDDSAVSFGYGVTDGTTSVAGSATLQITSVNDAPTGLSPALAAVNENAAANTLVATVSASDPDSGELFSFALLQDAAGRFTIDPSSGRLAVAPSALLDFEGQASFDVQIRVTDSGGQQFDQLLRIDLRDLPDTAPPLPPAPPAPVIPPAAPPPPAAGPPAAPAATAPTPAPAQPAPAPTGAPTAPAPGGGSAASGGGEVVMVSAAAPTLTIDAAPPRAGVDSGTAPSTAHVRLRESAAGLVTSISFEAAGNNEVPLSVSAWDEAAKGSIGEALRNALLSYRSTPIELDTLATGASAEPSDAPSPVLEMMQDPVRIASATFTAGFVWWLTRSGGLLTTLLMGAPSWRHVDLLPVLARSDDDDDTDGARGDESDARAEGFDDSAVAELFGANRPAGGRA